MSEIARPGLYGVGVGPGDPGWITLRAAEVLRGADVLALPRGETTSESHAAAIIAPVVDLAHKRVLSVPFATRGGPDAAEQSREAMYAAVADELAMGHAVAFPLIGDPFLYGSFIYLLARVRERLPAIPVEIVPGVTAFAAAAARHGTPLVMGDERLAVLPVVRESDLGALRETLARFDTVVLLKVRGCIPALLDVLDELGLTGGAWYAEHVGMAGERFETDVRQLRAASPPYLSLMVVHGGRERQ